MPLTASDALELTDWRRRVAELYAAVRSEPVPAQGHALWRSTRDALFRSHPQSPLPADDPLRSTGLSYAPYEPSLRFELPILPTAGHQHVSVPTGGDETTELDLMGRLELPLPIVGQLDVWWMGQYGGGLFIPLRDGTAGTATYGGGRYLLDTVKGADLGGDGKRTIIIDLNFLYHPSCRYNPDWVCPLAPRGNTIDSPVLAGELL